MCTCIVCNIVDSRTRKYSERAQCAVLCSVQRAVAPTSRFDRGLNKQTALSLVLAAHDGSPHVRFRFRVHSCASVHFRLLTRTSRSVSVSVRLSASASAFLNAPSERNGTERNRTKRSELRMCAACFDTSVVSSRLVSSRLAWLGLTWLDLT